ncbi:hypothetical protein A2U01_0061208, partial [Trifolium medium]|nr:hypothetical protein [Trifolium medium]
ILSSRGTFGAENIIFGSLRRAPDEAAPCVLCCGGLPSDSCAARRDELHRAQEVLRHAPGTVV